MAEPSTLQKHKPVMLIADDDPGIARFLASRCTDLGFEVRTAANGMQALLVANQAHPEVMIIDINMPHIDGLSVAARLLSPDKWPLEVIVITASAFSDTEERCLSFGAFHVRKGLQLWSGVRSALAEIFPDMAIGASEETGGGMLARAAIRRSPRVLIVDDDSSTGELLTTRLGKLGIDTVLATNGLQGYRHAVSEEPSLIISSYSTPEGDAHFLMQKLRSTASTISIPMIVVSTEPIGEKDAAKLKQESGRAHIRFLAKPIDTDELLAVVQEYCAFNVDPNRR